MSALLSLRHLRRQFPDSPRPAVADLSLDLGAGEILALIGPSGCGKTTTLRMIAGFDAPDAGEIHLQGREITALPPEKRGIGMVFQDYALFPHLTAAQNVQFGAADRQPATAQRFLEMVGLGELGARFPDQLSGGQQQRVALARSFAAGPGVILLDEPFSNLDASLRARTRREIRALLKASGTGIIFVTHDQEEALSFADRVAVMRDGQLLQIGPACEVYDRPANAFVAGFLGRTNLITGQVQGAECQTVLGRVPLQSAAQGPQGQAPQDRVRLSLRPETIAIRAARPDEVPQGRITLVEFRGHDLTYWVDCQGSEIQVDQMGGPRLTEGEAVILSAMSAAVPLTG
ncbi:ABC transporter ATP-binding protein [Xinfangfangia sp. D13-10-4-6]|uniref:ABC transporter ATP-binding protein n=1 Tax=Pseudogemmobacter hezensis TaxID=2737662 RepID=UPI00155414DC|nr:ABC transporter ATP-binding protein [Pseudogemmobacter hezensis]NPD16294.1 ABC transporter ATP-binding protein [Pseudogemmobacter hezensis]